jgi:uncharacterized protein (TIGR00730 family)
VTDTTPSRRRRRLPWQVAKSADDDPEAPARLARIMASPTYRQADGDPEFLAGPAARGARLELDYAKAENALASAGVGRTVVVFGSTRIGQPEALQRRHRRAVAALAAAPADPELRALEASARRLLDKEHYYGMAREFGRLVAATRARDPHDRLWIMTGGGPGLMEAANRGAFDAGADSIGLNITLPHEQFPNPYITPGLCFRFHYFAMRKLHFLLRAAALVAFPGGFGTLDELFETLTLIQTHKIPPVPVVLVGSDYWRRLVDFRFLAAEGMINPEDLDLIRFVDSAEAAWDSIRSWYAAHGNVEFPDGAAVTADGSGDPGRPANPGHGADR